MSTTDLAKALSDKGDPSGTLRIGVITAVDTGIAQKVRTDQTGTAWLNRDQGATLAVGDRVWMIKQGATFLVAGRLNGPPDTPFGKRKFNAQSVTSSTVTVNDTDLFVPLQPGMYRVELVAHYSSPAALADIRSKWVYSGTTATNGRSCVGPGSVTTAVEGDAAGSVFRASGHGFGTDVIYGTDAGLASGVLMEDMIVIPSTIGVLQWQWAQGASNANATSVSVASRLYITPIRLV